ncbi:MAG: chromosomal replication initiator protein DnaA [Nocardioidaceae bacterium]
MSEQLEPIWDAVREELRRETADFKFEAWIEPLELAGVADRTLYVRAPERIRTWVEERYGKLLQAAAKRSFHEQAVVELVGSTWQRRCESDDTEPSIELEGVHREVLNPKYTFEQFVIGEANRFAHAAALAAAELPAQAYNPLFLHGPPGLGKTHLLHAIGNYVRRYGAGLQVRYATVETFTSEFVDSLRERRTADFKHAFRSADVLLIDDVQFLAGRERTREEFFHTFNALVESGRQLVLTCDKHPNELADLEQRLTERFASGLVVELEPPARDARRAILEKRARLDGIDVDCDVLDELASAVTNSVRALEAALIRLVAYASLRGERPSPSLVRHLLGRLPPDGDGRPNIPDILTATAEQFGVGRAELLARSRRPRIATARQVAMYLVRELTDHSLPEIGRGVGNRNHTTVLHAINRVEAELAGDEELRGTVDSVRRRLEAQR